MGVSRWEIEEVESPQEALRREIGNAMRSDYKLRKTLVYQRFEIDINLVG